ncbi:cell division protein FtsX [Euryhalocaulis caribicus]|uniref:cell division protein FtsX n=1 Tax=Euryhalocaulis caribicus TaxID=1161401 RepID=UPI0003A6D1E8|nr:FtsX-like permease family protein [Euryhalocaulis caribicus]
MSAPKASPLLPPDHSRDRPLFLVVTILVFLACFAGLTARSAWQAAGSWTQDLSSEATVQILPGEDDDPDALTARAAELLSGVEGIETAEPLGADESQALLSPWFGDALPEELPAPRLIAVEGAADAEAMRSALEAENIEAVVDDHSRWEAEIARAATIAQLIALAILGLLALAAAAVIVFATGAGLAARRDVIEALKIAGAKDSYIANLFMRRFWMMGLKAGLAGAVIAGLCATGLYFAAINQTLLGSAAAPDVFDALILAAAPLVAGQIGAATAWFAVMAALKESN